MKIYLLLIGSLLFVFGCTKVEKNQINFESSTSSNSSISLVVLSISGNVSSPSNINLNNKVEDIYYDFTGSLNISGEIINIPLSFLKKYKIKKNNYLNLVYNTGPDDLSGDYSGSGMIAYEFITDNNTSFAVVKFPKLEDVEKLPKEFSRFMSGYYQLLNHNKFEFDYNSCQQSGSLSYSGSVIKGIDGKFRGIEYYNSYGLSECLLSGGLRYYLFYQLNDRSLLVFVYDFEGNDVGMFEKQYITKNYRNYEKYIENIDLLENQNKIIDLLESVSNGELDNGYGSDLSQEGYERLKNDIVKEYFLHFHENNPEFSDNSKKLKKGLGLIE